jgi:hypothetical protein
MREQSVICQQTGHDSERKKEYAILSGCHVGCLNTVDVRAVTENSQKNFNF